MHRLLLQITLVLCFLSAGLHCESFAAAPEAKDARTELEGDWEPLSIRNGNDEVPPEQLARMKFTFRGNRHTLTTTTLTVNLSGASLRVDATKAPKEIDMELDAKPGNEKQQRIIGIYKLEGDRLTIAYSRAKPKERLKNFPAKPEAGTEVVTLKRQAPAKKN